MKTILKCILKNQLFILWPSILASCIPPISVEGTSCPCPSGYQCCDSECLSAQKKCDINPPKETDPPSTDSSAETDNPDNPTLPENVDAETDTGTDIYDAGLNADCNHYIHCADGLVCHAWKTSDGSNKIVSSSPRVCVPQCDPSHEQECGDGKICRSISYIRGTDPPPGKILHTEACVDQDTGKTPWKCSTARCPKPCAEKGIFQKWHCGFFTPRMVFVCSWLIYEDCGLVCSRQTAQTCDAGSICSIDDGGVGSCLNKTTKQLSPVCLEETCEDVCGNSNNVATDYCDDPNMYRCWYAESEDPQGECSDICLRRPLGDGGCD